ncbi:MAG: hypothetical protein JXA15_09825 [Spirochaetales bacterium]|nr:hypothetical protein [Spirochaetales bacterium]
MSSIDWREAKYDETYEAVLKGLAKRRELEGDFGPDAVRGVLRHLYEQDGQDWVGRGEVANIDLAATIEAHEHFLALLEKGEA